jgi:large subunit ribosomal protein L2
VKVGMTLMSGDKAEATPGNCLPLGLIPLGLSVHCVELVPGQGAKLARSAGNDAQIMARDGDTVTLKLASGEVRIFNARCKATVGSVGNKDWGSIQLGKAGRKRYLGIRPTVRGVAMNPVDHPMGGGEGRTSGGSHPRSPWGKLAKGGKTRKPHKASNKVIVKRRK